MTRRFFYLLITVLILALFSAATIYANATLPAANWYAVAWVQATDTLHWINESGEQASIPRPAMLDEAGELIQKRLFISPNGRYLVIVSPLTSGNLGLGFYDFSTGQFVQTHEAQPNESLSLVPSADFTMTSSHFSIVLRNDVSSEWRILVFETATGNAVAQLIRTDPTLPANFITDTAWWPAIASFNIDEGMGTYVIQLQLVTDPQTMVTAFPSFKWYPDPPPLVADAPVVADALPFSPIAGFDVFKTTGQIVFTGFDGNGVPSSPAIGNMIAMQSSSDQLPVPLIANGAFTLNAAQWLHGGEWVGYRVQDGVFQPHFSVATADGSQDVPLGPNIGGIHSTPDGFLGVDASNWQLYHATDLTMDGFSAFFGNTVFQAGQPFGIIYTQPEGATFTLTTIVESPLVGDLGLQAPNTPSCPGAPATRLTVGQTARVTFTDGAPLNVRNAPSGDSIVQIPEGTGMTIIEGPSCANSYQWWNLRLENGTVGWAAEGDTESYFLEPYAVVEPLDPLVLVPNPTATPRAPLNVVIAVPLECPLSPPTQLQVGMMAHLVGTDGTLAMYANIADQTPTFQLPVGTNVTILGGPQCKGEIRMWHVSAIVNGSSVLGWISEGFGQMYYLMPGTQPIGVIIGGG